MASSFDFSSFVTRLEDLKITKNGWDELLISLTTAWNENSYDLKSTAGKVKSFIVSKYRNVPPQIRDDLGALTSGRLKPHPGDRGLRFKEHTPNSKLVPNGGKVDKPDSGKSERPTSKQHKSKPAYHQTSLKDYNVDINPIIPGDEKLQTHLENVWNLIHQGHVKLPYRQDEPDVNELALKLFNKTKSLVEEIKSLTAQHKDHTQKEEQHTRNLEQLFELLQFDDLAETLRPKSTDNAIIDGPITFEIMYKRVEQIKEDMKTMNRGDEKLQNDLENIWNILHQGHVKPPYMPDEPDLNYLALKLLNKTKSLVEEMKSFAELQQNVADLQDKLELANLERQAQEQSTRLSRIQTASMTGTYPVVNDLSDASRPTKLGERFSELYDFQWTDAFEQLIYSGKKEEDAIQHLYKLLEKCHTFCIETDKYQTSVIQSSSTCSFHNIQLWHVFTDIQLANVDSQMMLDLRKRNIEETTKNLQNQFVKKNEKNGNVVNGSVKVFVDLCVEICWLMRLHSPPLYLDTNADKQIERQFDTDIFRPYTRSGKTIEFIVWPPLFLHEGGPMLSKGTAQGSK